MDYTAHYLGFDLPVGFDTMERAEKARFFLHHFLVAKEKLPHIKRIVGEYHGIGDSLDSTDWKVYADDASGSIDDVVELQFKQNVVEAFDDFMNSWADHEHPGWENNEGGYGHVTFDLERRACRLEHWGYYTEEKLEGDHELFNDKPDKPDGA